jgi:O-antigen/teichoic acid export membrane protein
MNQSIKSTAVSGLKWTTIGTIGGALFQLLQISILTRFLPKEAFGLIAMALFVVNFTYIFVDMGFTSAILHRNNTTNQEYNSIYWFNLLISIIIYLIILALTPIISSFYKEAELEKILPILSLNLIILASGRLQRTIMQKEFRFKSISIIELFSFFCGLVSALVLAKNNYGVYSLVYSTLIASLFSSLLFIIKNIQINIIKLHLNIQEIKPFFKVGSYAMGSQFISFFSTDIDILIIGKMLGPSQLGLYSLAKQIVLKLYSIINPIITKVLSPLLSAMQEDGTKMKSYFLKITSILSTFNIPLYLLIFILAKEILLILYGNEYVEANYILSFLAIAYCTYSISNPVGSLQIATGRTDIGFKWAVLSLIVTPFAIYLSAFKDINTVAFIRALLSLIMMIPLWWIQLKPMANIQLKEYFKQFIKPYLLLIFISLAYLVSTHYFELTFGAIMNAIIKGIISMILFFGFLWFIDKKRINEIINLIPKLRNK